MQAHAQTCTGVSFFLYTSEDGGRPLERLLGRSAAPNPLRFPASTWDPAASSARSNHAGGMGLGFLAHRDDLDQDVAVKQLRDAWVSQGDAEPHLRFGHDTLAAQTTPSASWLRAAREDLVTAYRALGRDADAARFQSATTGAER